MYCWVNWHCLPSDTTTVFFVIFFYAVPDMSHCLVSFSYFSFGALLQHLLQHGHNIIDHDGDKLWYVPRYPLCHNGYNNGATVLDTRELFWYIQSFIIFLVSFVMSVLNFWSLSSELSVYLFGFYLWITVCPTPMPVFHYFSHLMCVYTYLILIMCCNVMWAFFMLHFADVCSCCHVCFVYSYSLSVGVLHVAPIFCHLPPHLYVSVVVVVVVVVVAASATIIVLFYFVLLFLSYLTVSLLFWKGGREVLCIVLWCVSLLVGVASYVDINRLSYWITLTGAILSACSSHASCYVHGSGCTGPLSGVPLGKPLMTNQMVWICWLYSNKPQQIQWLY